MRVELGEIESMLEQHPTVKEAVVTAREDDSGDKRLVAYIVPKLASNEINQTVITKELRNFLKEKLADYMVPSAFVMLAALPLTPNGKVDRRALPAPDQVRQELEETFVAPQDELELKLTEIWEKVLGVQPIGVRDNFFELGGHSLLAVRLVTEVEKVFDKNLPLSSFVEAQTVEQLANLLRQQDESAPWRSLVMIQPGSTKPPLFCVHAVWGTVLFYQKLVRYLEPDQPFYALQAQGLDGKQVPCTSVKEMAAHYIKEIRTVQPEGPYFIGGYSFGGWVAFEIARQLHAQGQEIALLTLFDTSAPGYHKPTSSSDDGKPSTFLDLSLFHLRKLLRLNIQDQLAYLRQRLVWHLMAGKLSIFYRIYLRYLRRSPQDLRLLDVAGANNQAAKSYVPQVYPGRLTLFRATDKAAGFGNDLDMGWGELATGGVEIYDISGSHTEIMEEPQLGHVAEKLKLCLDKAQANEKELTA
jgi:thioesterase domain-containing protein/acyl carrier protein